MRRHKREVVVALAVVVVPLAAALVVCVAETGSVAVFAGTGCTRSPVAHHRGIGGAF